MVMGSLSEEEDQFFDSRDDIASVSDSSSDCPEILESDDGVSSSLPVSVDYEVWIKNPGNIRERRNKFLKWMGLTVDQLVKDDEAEVDTGRITEHSGAVLRSSFDDGLSSSQSSMSCWSNDGHELLEEALEENFVCRIRNLDNGMEFIVDEFEQHGMLGRIREVSSNQLLTVAEFEKSLGLSPLVQRVMRREVEEASNSGVATQRVKMGWLRRLGAVACIANSQDGAGSTKYSDPYPVAGYRNQMVRVRSYKKRLKELSDIYMGQDIPAHEGSILTMKFSPDGEYLASAGEDGIVRVWLVTESERSDGCSILDINSSNLYFTVNDLSELVPCQADKEKKGKFKSLPTASNSACVILPQKVFRISEKPIHEFYGHCGEVLDLSWSNKKYLLSSSVDKSVRLWQVGCNKCLQVFLHNDYVTCVQFNPMDEDYFISGSIDGKVRIWAIPGCQVVDWTDIKEIVTAVCYRPDGKGGVIGSMSGNCRFYDASDNRLQLYAQVCLQGKKKSPVKRITGFQFSPNDSTRLMVTSADSQIRILQGIDVVCKYRGIRNAGSQISASFTSDGSRIVSASEDSNVYVWNYSSQAGPLPKMKTNWSCERFFSNNVSVAIPWSGMAYSLPSISPTNLDQCSERVVDQPVPALNHGFFSESLSKCSATWPEEKLALSSLAVSSAMCKSQYKFLKVSCHGTHHHHHHHAWGMVIVTAGWDGRIRTFQNYGLPVRV